MTDLALQNPLWRLQNLYAIKDARTGKTIPFRPHEEQITIFKALLSGLRRIIILKARRLGMSTGINVYMTDLAMFHAGIQESIVDLTQDDASKKLINITKIAFNYAANGWFQGVYKIDRENDSMLQISSENDSPSSIYAGKNARGGANQFLHASELGVIQADDPRRFDEIITGAIPSAQHGTVVIETTWKGGRGGKLYEIVKRALEKENKTVNDWHVFFFPWWLDKTYTLEEGQIDPSLDDYFAEVEEKIGRRLSDGQRRWYSLERETQGIFMFREFPSSMEEMFKAPIEGSIYGECIDRSRSEGRICSFPVDNSALVHTLWDLGAPMNTVTVFFQLIGYDIRVIDVIMHKDWTPVQRVSAILSKGYPLGDHFLPHDTAQKQKSGRTYSTELLDAGLSNIRQVPQTVNMWLGINRVRQLFPRFLFRKPVMDDALDLLAYYHTRPDSTTGVRLEFPVHDHTSHVADAFRVLGEAEMHGMLKGGSFIAKNAKVRHFEPKVSMGVNSARNVLP